MASKEGSSYDWILGEDADEDLEPWQRVLKENAKNATCDESTLQPNKRRRTG